YRVDTGIEGSVVRKASARSSSSRTVAAKLSKLGIRRDLDLVLHLPLRYEDETRVTPIANAPPGLAVQVEGTVRGPAFAPGPGGARPGGDGRCRQGGEVVAHIDGREHAEREE